MAPEVTDNGIPRSRPPTTLPSTGSLTTSLPYVAAFLVGLHYPLGLELRTSTLAAFTLAPVWFPVLGRFRWARAVIVLGTLGTAAGLLLAWVSSDTHEVARSLLIAQTSELLGAISVVGLLLWVREAVGVHRTVLCFGLGALVVGMMQAPGSENPFKYELSWPLTIVVLSLMSVRGYPPLVAVACTLLLGATAAVMDSRSFFGFCLMSAVLVLRQSLFGRRRSRSSSRVGQAALLLGGAVGLYLVMQSLLLRGAIGEDMRIRTERQMEYTGSLLLGGRPEWAVTLRLAQQAPWGLGVGVVPNSQEVALGSETLASLRIAGGRAYAVRYMFGGQFRLHSIIADFWARFSIPGLALSLLFLWVIVAGLTALIAQRQITALTALLGLTCAWALAFGPIHSNLIEVCLAVAVLSEPRILQRRIGANSDTGGPGAKDEWKGG